MTAHQAAKTTFRCVVLEPTGRTVRRTMEAHDAAEAARALRRDGVTPLSLEPVAVQGAGSPGVVRAADMIGFLRAFALMIEAGVDLLEALDVAAGAAPRRYARPLSVIAGALKSGQSLADALEAHLPGLPTYVSAMIRTGEATGRLAEMTIASAEQLTFEDRLRREVGNALTYPMFLLAAGAAAVLFIFTQVIPKFAVLVGDDRTGMPFISRALFAAAGTVDRHPGLLLASLALGVGGVALVIRHPGLRAWGYGLARRAPLVGPLLDARDVSGWARLTGFALANGVDLLQAARLARTSLPPGAFRTGLERYEDELRGGAAIDAALGRTTRLPPADLTLLRAGQRSGGLARMFDFIAEAHERRLRDALRRITVLIEPVAVGFISLLVGFIALSLLLALSSVYDRVQ